MTVGKVKDFNFSSSGKTVGLCSGGSWGKTKYAKGGQAVRAPAAKMKAGRAAAGKMAIAPQMPMKKGGVKKFADGGPAGMPAGALAQLQAAMSQQKMPADAKAKMQMMARAAMAQKMAQAQGRPPMAPPQGMPMPAGRPAMKKGGFVERGTGMIPNKGTLGVKGNKNPGEMGGKAPVKSHPKYNYADGGDVAVAGRNPNMMKQRQMMEQARNGSMQQSPLQQMQQPPMPPMGQQAGRQVLPSRPMVPPRPQVMPPQQPPMGQQDARPSMGQMPIQQSREQSDMLRLMDPPQRYYNLQASSPGMPPSMGQSAGQMQPPPPMGQSAVQMQPSPNNQFGNLSGGFNVGQPMGNQQASSNMMTLPQGQQGYMPIQQPMTQSGAVSSMPPQRMGGIG